MVEAMMVVVVVMMAAAAETSRGAENMPGGYYS
jgi:hypothetical protein